MMESLHDQIHLNRLLQNQKLGRKIPVSLLLFTNDHHYYNANAILDRGLTSKGSGHNVR